MLMILAVDVGYFERGARAAGLLFQSWDSEAAHKEIVVDIPQVEDYVPGQFFRRELPCIEMVLASVCEPLLCVVIDGYVSLGDPPVPGLGAHLWERLGCTTPVIGVAKTVFAGTPEISKLYRGASAKPLFITAAGIPINEAKRHILSMKGKYRLPELLKAVDQLSRTR